MVYGTPRQTSTDEVADSILLFIHKSPKDANYCFVGTADRPVCIAHPSYDKAKQTVTLRLNNGQLVDLTIHVYPPEAQ